MVNILISIIVNGASNDPFPNLYQLYTLNTAKKNNNKTKKMKKKKISAPKINKCR